MQLREQLAAAGEGRSWPSSPSLRQGPQADGPEPLGAVGQRCTELRQCPQVWGHAMGCSRLLQPRSLATLLTLGTAAGA